MRMIEHIKELVDAGVSSLKIEGRAKSAYYVGVITNAYRAAVDLYAQNPGEFQLPQWIADETRKVSHREYSTGFYFGRPDQCYKSGGYVRECDIVANVDSWEEGLLTLTQRNYFKPGDRVEVLEPKSQPVELTVKKILSLEGEELFLAHCAGEHLVAGIEHSRGHNEGDAQGASADAASQFIRTDDKDACQADGHPHQGPGRGFFMEEYPRHHHHKDGGAVAQGVADKG